MGKYGGCFSRVRRGVDWLDKASVLICDETISLATLCTNKSHCGVCGFKLYDYKCFLEQEHQIQLYEHP